MLNTSQENLLSLKRWIHSFGVRIQDEHFLFQKELSAWPNNHMQIVNQDGKKEGQIVHNDARTKLHFCYPYGNVMDASINRFQTNRQQLVVPFQIKNHKESYYDADINYDFINGTATFQDGALSCKLTTFLDHHPVVTLALSRDNIYLKKISTGEKIASSLQFRGCNLSKFYLRYENPNQMRSWKLEGKETVIVRENGFKQETYFAFCSNKIGEVFTKQKNSEVYLNAAMEEYIQRTCPEYYALLDQMVAYFQVPRQNILCSLLTIIYEDLSPWEFKTFFEEKEDHLRVKTYHRPCQTTFRN